MVAVIYAVFKFCVYGKNTKIFVNIFFSDIVWWTLQCSKYFWLKFLYTSMLVTQVRPHSWIRYGTYTFKRTMLLRLSFEVSFNLLLLSSIFWKSWNISHWSLLKCIIVMCIYFIPSEMRDFSEEKTDRLLKREIFKLENFQLKIRNIFR